MMEWRDSPRTVNIAVGAYQEVPKRLYQGVLSATQATLYTAPATQTGANPLFPPKTRVREIIIANVDTVTRTVTLYAVASGGSALTSNCILPAVQVAAATFVRIELSTVMEQAGFLVGNADAANVVTLTVSGEELLPRS